MIMEKMMNKKTEGNTFTPKGNAIDGGRDNWN
jgi:hypothetical protein